MAVNIVNGVVRERAPVYLRSRDVVVEDGWAGMTPDLDAAYEPAKFPDLPSLLSKATTEAEVKRFLKSSGPLGFWRLAPDKQKSRWPEKYGPRGAIDWEPVDWIIAQASTIGFALHILDGLRAKSKSSLEGAITKRRIRVREFPDGEGGSLGKYATYFVAKGGAWGGEGGKLGDRSQRGGWFQTDCYPLYEDERGLERHAEVILVELINANTEGVREQLWVEQNRGIGLEHKAKGLIELIWLHVRKAAMGRSEIRRCLECGSPFVVTDNRQRFCPPDLPGTKSRCAARWHKRNQRKPKS